MKAKKSNKFFKATLHCPAKCEKRGQWRFYRKSGHRDSRIKANMRNYWFMWVDLTKGWRVIWMQEITWKLSNISTTFLSSWDLGMNSKNKWDWFFPFKRTSSSKKRSKSWKNLTDYQKSIKLNHCKGIPSQLETDRTMTCTLRSRFQAKQAAATLSRPQQEWGRKRTRKNLFWPGTWKKGLCWSRSTS